MLWEIYGYWIFCLVYFFIFLCSWAKHLRSLPHFPQECDGDNIFTPSIWWGCFEDWMSSCMWRCLKIWCWAYTKCHMHGHAQLCLTFCDSMDSTLPGSSVYGTFLVRILEGVAISSSRGSSQPRDWNLVSCIAGRFLTAEPPGKPNVVVINILLLIIF